MRYEFTHHPERKGWFLVQDTKWMFTCAFEEHRFNDTQEFPELGQLPDDSAKVAEAMRELGEWLFAHHYAEVMPLPVYELRRSEDDSEVAIIRHKRPCFTVTFKADEVDSLTDAADALRKCAEFLTKRMKRHE